MSIYLLVLTLIVLWGFHRVVDRLDQIIERLSSGD